MVDSLLFFASTYVNKFGSPPSIFSTWRRGTPCNAWAGLTCDDWGNILAVNLRGRGLTGPFPGPTVFQDLFWTYFTSTNAYSSTVRIFDFSNNALYGLVDPLLSLVDNMDYLDFSGNFFTGTLPAVTKAKFKFLNVGSNYLVGSPVITGKDRVTPECPGLDFAGSFDLNCFDVRPSLACGRVPTNRTAPTPCSAYCGGATSAAGGACRASPRTPVCKPSGTKFVCSK